MTLRKPLQRSLRRRAFTLMEMLIVVAIIVALAGIGTYFLLPQLQKSKDDTAKLRASQIEKAITTYYINNDAYPGSLQELTRKDARGYGPYLTPEDAVLDPWGQPYQFDASGGRSGQAGHVDVWTTSKETGNEINNWSRK